MMQKKLQSGFTLVETLVAITILLIVMIGPMTISSQTAKTSSFSSEQVTAFFLAQEGVELVQKVRDDMLVKSFASDATAQERTPWANFTNPTGPFSSFARCYASNGCGLEIVVRGGNAGGDVSSAIDCGSPSAAKPQPCHLWYSPSNLRSKFTHTSGGNTMSPFNRRIQLTLVNPNEVQIKSVVTWQSGNTRNEQRVEVESRLFNLYGN